MNEQWRSRITIEPGKRGGRPCIRGMRITVYDVTGRRVRSVVDERLMPAGDHEAVWDGRNEAGLAVGAGVYFSVLEYDGTRRTRRLVVRP